MRSTGREMWSSRPRLTGGFTLIEMMVAVTIVGLLATFAVPNFLHYMRKSRTVEVYDSLTKIAQGARVYFTKHHVMPPATPWSPSMTHADACAQGHSAFPTGATKDFDSSEWRYLLFRPVGNIRYRYRWTVPSATMDLHEGIAWASGDLDCDGDLALFQIILRKLKGDPLQQKGTYIILNDETE